MLSEELAILVQQIVDTKTERQTLEVKAAQHGTPKRLYDTLSSFSNQDEGGIIVFGIDEDKGFEVVGVHDAQLLQKQVTEQCNQMEPPVRPLFTIFEHPQGLIVSVEIPGIDLADRPCFYAGKGRLKGSYKRCGESDLPMTEYEIYSYEAYRKKHQDDIRPVPNTFFADLDQSGLANYLLHVKANKPNLARLSDEEILRLTGIVRNGKITLGAQLLFGLYPQAFIPQLCITAISVTGTELGPTDSLGRRFDDNRRIEGAIPEMLASTLQFLKGNLKSSTAIDAATGVRTDSLEIPLLAIREVVLNALVHRDYSIHTEGMPITVRLFADRLEVINPGGLYGRTNIQDLGKVQPDTRNPMIATVLEDLGLTENRYSGIPTIRHEMAKAGLPAPEFISDSNSFKVVLYRIPKDDVPKDPAQTNGSKTEAAPVSISPHDRKARSLIEFCDEARTRTEIAEYLGVNVSYAVNAYVKPLIAAGKLAMSNPEKPRSRSQTYFAL